MVRKKNSTNEFLVLRPNAAGIDIGAMEMFVAVPADRDVNPVRTFETFTRDLNQLVGWLLQCGIDTVAMESTGVFWKPLFQLLEDAGIEVFLVNARHLKNVPGRKKTDVLDCKWLQYLHSVGLLNGSYQPPQVIASIRTYLRHRDNLVKLASIHIQHLHKALTQMNLQIHNVISDITGKTGLAILDAILSGEQDPKVLAQLRHERMKASPLIIQKSLEGDYRPEHLFTLRQSLASYRRYLIDIQECESEMNRRLQEFNQNTPARFKSSPDPATKKHTRKSKTKAAQADDQLMANELKKAFGIDLLRVPSLGLQTILTIFGEIGADFSKFRSASAFVSWLAVCPNNQITGGKVKQSQTRKTKSSVTAALRMAAQSLSRNSGYLGNFYRRMRGKFGGPKAITAAAHKLARIIYHLVTTGQEYDESVYAAAELRQSHRQESRLRNKARALGFHLVPIAESAS